MELVSLALLAGASLGVMAKIKYSKKEEGFQEADPINGNVRKYFPKEHTEFIKNSIGNYNPLTSILNPSNTVIKDASGKTVFTPDNESIQNTLKPYITKVQNDGSYTYDKEQSDKAVANYRINKDNAVIGDINKCETTKLSIKNGLVDCSIFKEGSSGSNDYFTKNCGVCHKDTITSKNVKPSNGIGGLYYGSYFKGLLDDEDDTERSPLQPRYESYEPKIGDCATDYSSLSKSTCEKINKKIQCERAQSSAFEQNLEGCYECNDSKNKFYYVEDGKTALRQPTTLVLTGNGECEFSIGSGGTKRWYAPVSTGTLSVPSKIKKTFALSSTGKTVSIPLDDKGEAADGKIININLKTQGDDVPSLSGKVIGYVNKPSGTKGSYINDIRENDISQFAMDTSTRVPSIPFISGGAGLSVIQPHFTEGNQGTLLSISVYVPFTYIATDQIESTFCQGPYIRNKQNFMNISQNPCFSSTSTAGNYNKACLQGLFIASGCTKKGSGYPDTNEKVAALNKQGTLSNITSYLRNRYTRSFSGKDSETGKTLPINTWQEDIQFCKDQSEIITNYCDTLTSEQKKKGPVSPECINYIYRDGDVGPAPRKQKPYGTYNMTDFGNAKSLYESGFKDRYCTPEGTMSPYDEKGVMRPDIVKEIQSKGGIESIKQFYRNIHSKANQGGLTNAQRALAVKQCYGNDLGGAKIVDIARTQGVDKSKAGNLLDGTITDRKVKKIRIYASTSYVMISQLIVKDTTGTNVALKKPTSSLSQLTVLPGFPFSPGFAVDGDARNRVYIGYGQYFCSAIPGAEQWWEVDLQSSYDISEIVYYSPERTTSGFNPKDMKMNLYNSQGQIVNTKIFSTEAIQKFGNFTSTGPEVTESSTANKGSKVRISGPMAFLVISQLVVKDKLGNNVALKKPTSSSSVATFIPGMPYASSLAVDGNASNKVFFPTFPMGTYFCSSGQGANEWWEVDLQGSYDIAQIVYYNCGLNCSNNPSGMKLEISNTEGKVIYTNTFTSDLVQTFDVVPLVEVTPTPLAPSDPIKGNRIRVLASSTNFVMISQLIVFDKRGNNVALRKPTKANSTAAFNPALPFYPSYAVDGNASNRGYNSLMAWGQYYCSAIAGAQEWWEVDLQGSIDIDTILYFPPDRVTSGFNPEGMKFKIYDSVGTVVKESTFNSDIIQSFDISPPTPIPDTLKTAPKAKKIRIYGTAGGLIQISQLVVKDTTGQNIAFGKSASSSSARDKYDASYAVGGNVKVKTPSDNMFISGKPGADEWWEVDLGDTYSITQIIYYNCGGGCINYSGLMTLKLLSDCDKEITTRTFTADIIQYFNFV